MSLKWFGILQRTSSTRYHYQPLKEGDIRVLRLLPFHGTDDVTSDTEIQCEVIHVPLQDPADYEALSYVWGLPKILPVTESLWVALRHLRYKDQDRYLWVDQICINQEDTAEKSSQVGCMGEIYSKATCTVVWLGPKGPDAALLQDMYTELSQSLPDSERRGPGGVQMLDQKTLAAMMGDSNWDENNNKTVFKRRNILLQFLNLPWFTRAWVYQEVVTAPKVDVVWGTIVLPFDFVTGLVVSAYGIARGSDDRRWHRRIKSTTGFAPLRAMFHDRTAHRNGELDFLNVLWHARKHLSAGNDRDYVYAFLAVNKYTVKDRTHPSNTGLNNSLLLQDRILPDYDATVEHVYTHLALTAINTTRTLDIFQYIVPTKRVPGNYSLPSWVPNWADKHFVCGSPIFVPGVPWKTNASPILQSSDTTWTPSPTPSPLHVLPTSGFTLGRVETVLEHSFKHTYFASTLKNALRLDDLTTLINTHHHQQSPFSPSGTNQIPRSTILETILAAGSFTPGPSHSQTPYTTPHLLAAYDTERETIPPPGEDDAGEAARNWLRQAAEVAAGKRVFLLDTTDQMVGMGFSTLRVGDLVAFLFGCRAPVVLRMERGGGMYTVVGLCFVHGCMDGVEMEARWRGRVPERFLLV
ncbi:heterokaryon incompatibility protein-domain-containing protein [Echria macrotheca]|uniref:Heterokaryon incompatibility protein-domain-containing protein n=1 Tax=Echria macrotheca TaxID=438768 RepID=A0AAJ0BGX2_9PEZI|nr:heterokaryon incompatibility protein-domain-containing protein [Echria macrotheca]